MNFIEQIAAQAKLAAEQQNPSVAPMVPATPTAAPPTLTPQQAYSAQAGQMNGYGNIGNTPDEQFIRTANHLQLIQRYGPDIANQIATSRAMGQQQLQNDIATPRNFSQLAADTVTDVGSGVANMVGGASALAAGLVSRDAGIGMSNAMKSLNEFTQESQSPALNAARRIDAAQNQEAQKDNKALMQQAIYSGESEASAGIKRVFRDMGADFINKLSNPSVLGSAVAQGIGSMLPVGAITGVGGVVGRAALNKGVSSGAITAAEAAKIAHIGSEAGGALAIGTMEAGGAYQQSVQQVMETKPEQLMAGSPEYQSLIQAGTSPQEAQQIIASKAGLASAGLTLPFAILLGKTVAKFEADPLKTVASKVAVRNIASEAIEEGAQGGASQFFGNAAIKQYADKNQDLTQGVGEQISTGALAGMGTAGVMQAPSLAFGGAEAAKNALPNKPVPAPVPSVVGSPSAVPPAGSLNTVSEQAQTAHNQAPVMAERMNQEIAANGATPEVQAEQAKAVNAVTQAFSYDPATYTGNDALKEKLAGSTNLVQAIKATGDHLLHGKLNDTDAIKAVTYLQALMDKAEAVAGTPQGDALVNAAMEATADPESKAFVQSMQDVFNNYGSSPEIINYANKAAELLAQKQAPTEVTEKTTPEIVTRAQYAPQTLRHETVNNLLAKHEAGEVTLSDAHVMRLKAAAALTKSMEELTSGPLGMEDPIAIVARHVGFNTSKEAGQNYPSIAEYSKTIVGALAKGDTASALAAANDLRNLAVTFNNKTGAMNESLRTGQTAHYDFTAPGYDTPVNTRTTGKGLTYFPNKPRSQILANQIAAEAQMATGLINNLREVFPQLSGVAPVELTPLAPELVSKKAANHHTAVKAKQVNTTPAPNPITGPKEAPVDTAPDKLPWEANKTVKPKTVDKPVTERIAIRLGKGQTVKQAVNFERSHPDFNGKSADERIAIAEQVAASLAPKEKVELTKLSDAELNSKLEKAMDKKDYQNDPEFKALDAEMTKRESAQDNSDEMGLDKLANFGKEQTKAEPKTETPKPVEVVKEDTNSSPLVRAEQLLKGQDGKENLFTRIYKIGKETRFTNLIGDTYDAVVNALGSKDAFTSFAGKDAKVPTDDQLTEARKYFNSYGANLIVNTGNVVKDFLETKVPIKGINLTRIEVLRMIQEGKSLPDGVTHFEDWANGLGSFNALIDPATGTIDEYFLNALGFAASNWMLTATGKGIAKYSEQQVANITGVPVDSVTDGLRNLVSVGLDNKDIIRDIAQAFERILGVTVKEDAPIFRAQGLSGQLATLVFDQMIPGNGVPSHYFETLTMRVTETGQVIDLVKNTADGKVHTLKSGTVPKETKVRTIVRYIPVKPVIKEGVGISSVLDQLLNVAPDNNIFFNKEDLKISQNQLRSSVPLTSAEKSAQQAQQETPHTLNVPFQQLIKLLPVEAIQKMMGGENTENLNVNHRISVEGKGITQAGSRNQIDFVMNEIASQAVEQAISPEDVSLFYKYETTSTGRSMMQGKYNPQSDKAMRQLITPMKAVVDLTTDEDMFAWNLASIQMLGAKAYAMLPEQVTAEANKVFNHPDVVAAIKVMENVLSGSGSTSEIVAAMQKAAPMLEDGITFEAMHVLLDRARYNLSQDKTAFESRLYLEADGVANGPAGAMAMLSSAQVTPEYVTKMAKVGLFIGRTDLTMNQHRQGDNKDAYTLGGENAAKAVVAKLNSYKDSKNGNEMKAAHQATLEFLSAILPAGDISFDRETGNLTIKRGVTKNPLTVTVYGSGAAGIASKILGLVLDNFYSRISESNSIAEFKANGMTAEDFKKYFDFLTTLGPVEKEGVNEKTGKTFTYYGLETFGTKRNNSDFTNEAYKEFTLKASELNALKANIQQFFVKPLVAGITETVGTDVMNNTKAMVVATNIQSVLAKEAYKNELAKFTAAKIKEDPSWDPVKDGFSKKDLKALSKQVEYLNIKLATDNQQWEVGNSEEGSTDTIVSRNPLSKRSAFPLPGLAPQPSSPGVQVIPYLVIGQGDAAMVQNLFNSEERPQGILQVFDGINIGLNDIVKAGPVINKAMADAWLNNNPLRTVADTFSKATSIANVQELLANLPYEELKNINQSLEPFGGSIENLATILNNQANRVERNHQVIRDIGFAADQMAATGQSYVEGDSVITSEEGITEALSNAYLKIADQKIKLTGNLQVLDYNDTKKLVNRITDSKLRDLAKLALNVNGKLLADMQTVVASPADLISNGHVQDADMFDGILSGSIKGFYDPVNNKLVLANGFSMETLVHELVHAATMQAILANASGSLKDSAWSQAVSNSVQAMEAILDDLLTNGWDVSKYNQETKDSYNSMLATIQRVLGVNDAWESLSDSNPVQRAYAVNELMAWTLANQQLRAVSSFQQFKQALRGAWGMIKAILFGSATPPNMGSDVFSQMNFHTQALMHAQGSMPNQAIRAAQQALAQGPLMHSTAYGQDERIAEIGAAFHAKVGALLATRTSTLDRINNYVDTKASMLNAVQIRDAVQSVGFLNTPQQAAAFAQITGAMATQANISPLVMNEAQSLFTEAMKQLKPEDFLAHENDRYDAAKMQAASDKYDMLMGRNAVINDQHGRTSLLPVFIGLGMVDPVLRRALTKVDIPKKAKEPNQTFDERLQTAANSVMRTLQDKLVNGKRNPKNVNDALDSLAQTLIDDANNSANLVERLATSAQGTLNQINKFVADGISSGSKKLGAKANNIAANTSSKTIKLAAQSTSIFSNIFNEEGANTNAEASIQAINKTKLPEVLKSIVKDLTGRVESNKHVYDMIKLASSKVSKVRQFYKERLPATLIKAFKEAPTEDQWTAMFKAIAKVDLSSLVPGSVATSSFRAVYDTKFRTSEIKRLENEIRIADPKDAKKILAKANQLANYMVTGIAGPALARNADAVANLVTESSSEFNRTGKEKSSTLVRMVNQLISLQAIENTPEADRKEVATLVKDDPEAMKQVLGIIKSQAVQEQAKRVGMGRFNAVKGYIPSTGSEGASVQVAADTEEMDMRAKGYTKVAKYTGSKLFSGTPMSYYFAPISGKAPYNQGIFQNARNTVGGVDADTGFSAGIPTAGRITQKTTVRRLALNMHMDSSTESLIPIFNDKGAIVAFERSIDPAQLERLNPSTHLAKMLGTWMGRQAEESLAWEVNRDALARAANMWNNEKHSRTNEYINVLDPNAIKDPIMKDALSLMPKQVREEAQALFGKNKFMVRKDVFEDLFGYRDASLTDFWTGNSRWSPETQKRIRGALEGVFGKKALTTLATNEQRLKNLVKDVKTLIVVKSVVVPVANFVANIYQLSASGVPIQNIIRGMRDKVLEADTYTKSTIRKMELQVELLAAEGNPTRANKLKAQIQSIEDSHKRLSIWPLIEAGEFGSISDVGISHDEVLLSEGRLQDYIEAKLDKLPDAAKTLGKNILITKDTALFQGLQKSMEYGDFLAKAIQYDHLRAKGMSQADALGVITDEFVNYDRLPGRVRGSLENFGLAWFYNYKLRIAKTAFRMIRQDPVRLALLAALPLPTETPVSENIFTKGIEGTLGYSLGPGMGFHSIGMNPIANALF